MGSGIRHHYPHCSLYISKREQTHHPAFLGYTALAFFHTYFAYPLAHRKHLFTLFWRHGFWLRPSLWRAPTLIGALLEHLAHTGIHDVLIYFMVWDSTAALVTRKLPG